MAEAEPIGFNKRRAEGRDKSNKPKDLQLKVRKLNPTNTVSYVQILGTGMDTQDTSSSVLLFFDKQRFIFNVGEGLQRFCTEHKIKLSKVDHVFLSRVCSETAGGLPGLLLTLAGMGEEGMSVNVWGPSDFKYLVDAMRSFIPNAAMVHTHSFGAAPGAGGDALADRPTFAEPIVLVNNEVVKISAILLQPGYLEVHKEKRDQILNFPLSNSQDPNGKALPVQKPGDISVVYVCELPEILGKFDPAKAVALGLKAGPKYSELQHGNSVMSDRQNIMVHPSDVLGPSLPGPIVVLVDCPTPSHLQELLSTQSLNNFYVDAVDQNLNSVKSVNCVIHLSPSSITVTPEYQNWMKRFGGAQHIMGGHEIKNLKIPVLKSSARIAARLNYLCPQFFPAPGFWSPQHLMNSMPEHITSCEDSAQKCWESYSAENLLKFHLRPYAQLGLDRSGIPSLLTPTEVVNELVAEIPEIEIAAEQVREFWEKYKKPENIVIEEPWMTGNASGSDINSGKQVLDDNKKKSYLPGCLENITREDMEVVLLGTGSSQPSKYRNVSSIYINLFSKGSLLLDCGEGSLAQLKRRFGVKGADDAVRSLRCIWISHIHADHHTGLARILALRRQLLREVDHEPLLVIGPRQLKSFLDAYQKLEDLDMEFLDCRHTTESSWDAFKDKEESNRNELPPRDPISVDNKGEGEGVMTTGATLFARGSSMQSYWKKPVSPGNTGMGLLKKLKNVLDKAGLEALVSVPVLHCPQSFGLVLNAAERNNSVGKRIPGWKLVYSGDTRPCQELVDASRGATVLIHEATFEDAMVEEAIEKNHSTTKEAIEVGSSAGAYRIILTHFSQRYPKIPVFDETHMHKTCIAFDMMSINIADLPLLPEVLPYLKLLFKNEMMVDESDEAVCQAI